MFADAFVIDARRLTFGVTLEDAGALDGPGPG
jgi:hypothetical protein